MATFRKPKLNNEYILEADRESDNPTVFVYRDLTEDEKETVSTMSSMTFIQAQEIQKIQGDTLGEELSPEQVKKIAVLMGNDPQTVLRNATKMYSQAVLKGLTEIKNMIDDETGEVIDVSVDDYVQYGNSADKRELGMHIMRASLPGKSTAAKSKTSTGKKKRASKKKN